MSRHLRQDIASMSFRSSVQAGIELQMNSSSDVFKTFSSASRVAAEKKSLAAPLIK